MKITGEEDMMRLKSSANEAGICSYIVEDAGHTQVEPGSKTVLALGPAPKSKIDKITSSLKLL